MRPRSDISPQSEEKRLRDYTGVIGFGVVATAKTSFTNTGAFNGWVSYSNGEFHATRSSATTNFGVDYGDTGATLAYLLSQPVYRMSV